MRRIGAALAGVLAGLLPAQRIRRPEPPAAVLAAGSHLPWRHELAPALAEARRRRTRVLWYVPTVPNSPMDRKRVLDLYVKTGFFSEPSLEPLLRSFVLLERRPNAQEVRRYGLRAGKFIEPGFLVLDSRGKALLVLQAVTTFAPDWFAAKLAPLAPARSRRTPGGRAAAARAALARGRPAAALALLREAPAAARSPEERFLEGAALFLAGRHREADRVWAALARAQPEHPQGRRALAEHLRYGPLARGFYSYEGPYTERAAAAATTTVPARPADIPVLVARGRRFLVAMQDEDGAWRDTNYDFGGLDSLPNVQVAVSAICGQTLLALGGEEGRRAAAKALAFVLEPKHAADEDRDEWIFAKVYPLRFALAARAARLAPAGGDRGDLERAIPQLIDALLARQERDGAFRHEYPNPFVTALALLVLARARRAGFDVPRRPVERALAALERCRTKKGFYSYFQVRGRSRARATPQSAAGRTALCEAARFAWGHGGAEEVARAVAACFAERAALDAARKYDDHAPPWMIGGFFFYYDLDGLAAALELLGPGHGREWRALRDWLLALPELDGCFVDSHELGRSYGTAVALRLLHEARDRAGD